MIAFGLVFLGAGLGGMARYAVSLAMIRWLGPDFPWGTLIVNIIGGLAMGLLAGYLSLRFQHTDMIRLVFGVGILGGFTTFSAFSMDAVLLFQRGDVSIACIYILASIFLSIAGVASGLYLIKALA